MYRFSLPVLGCMLACLPIISNADCDTKYKNMYVYITMKNRLNSTIECSVSNMDGSWDPSAPSSAFNQVGAGDDSPQAAACYDDSGDNTVSGTITCWNTVMSGGILTKSQEIGTMNFSHKCKSSLNHVNGGSCLWGSYSDTVTSTPENGFNIPYGANSGTGTHNALNVNYKIKE